MDVFYPADQIEVFRQMCAFACWAFGARYGWWLAGVLGRSLRELSGALLRFFHRPKKPRP